MSATGRWIHEMGPIKASEDVPANLVEYMDQHGLESAIIHTALLEDEAPVLKAHQAGKKIVFVKRDPPCMKEEADMYKRLEDAGILTTPKRIYQNTELFELLSTLFLE
jgi:hypothetical protein